MVYSLGYRRPTFVSIRRKSIDSELSGITLNETPQLPGIPAALSFDKIVDGGTCPPATVRDFMDYLLYVEHSAENLQFYLWYRDYIKRFNSGQTTDTRLALPWTQGQQDSAVQAARAQKKQRRHAKAESSMAIFKGTDFENESTCLAESRNPFNTPPRTPSSANADKTPSQPWESVTTLGRKVSPQGSPISPATTVGRSVTTPETYRQQAAEIFESAGLKKPFTIQPFREEIDRIIVTYIHDNAPRQLNISYTERFALLHALAYTTHPTALAAVNKTIESSLRRQSHPNFIRWLISNGNRPRVVFARTLGITTIVLGCIAAIVLALSNAGRGWRALCAIPWMIGISTLFTAWKGMCVVLHGMHRRHLKPWEMFQDNEHEIEYEKGSLGANTVVNSYEDQPWVKKYEKRNLIRKVFDREVWIEEPALRQIQDTIFLQALLTAVIGSAILTMIFLLVPSGHLF